MGSVTQKKFSISINQITIPRGGALFLMVLEGTLI